MKDILYFLAAELIGLIVIVFVFALCLCLLVVVEAGKDKIAGLFKAVARTLSKDYNSRKYVRILAVINKIFMSCKRIVFGVFIALFLLNILFAIGMPILQGLT